MPRAGPLGTAAADPRQAQPVDPRAKHRQQRRQEGEAVDDGNPDDDRSRSTHRGQEGALEEQHRGQPDGHRDSGEGDGAACRGHRDRERLFAGFACGELVAEPADDEQRVVDRDGEADERDDVDRVLRHVGEAPEEERAAHAADDREHADAQRQQCGDDGREDQNEHEQRDGQGHHLAALNVRLERGVERVVERHLPRGDHRQRSWMNHRQQLVEVLRSGGRLVSQLDFDQRVVLVARYQVRRVGHVVRRENARHARVCLQRRHRLLER